MTWIVQSEPQGDSEWSRMLADGIEDWLRFDLDYNPEPVVAVLPVLG